MSDLKPAELSQLVEGSKDGVGVVTNDAFHNQLASLTADDWTNLARMYPKSSAHPNDMYIEFDAKSGNGVIHNDLREAKSTAESSFVGALWDTVKKDAGTLEKAVGIPAAAGGLVGAGGEAALMVAGSPVMSVTAAEAATGIALAGGAGAAAVGGAAALIAGGAEVIHTAYRRSEANADLKNGAEVSFHVNK